MEKKKKVILIIEDDTDVLSVIVKHLELMDFEVNTAADGMEGVKQIESGGFDLVITDIVMPYISGIGVMSMLKEKFPHIPVIAITGYGKEPESVAMEKKADLVLAKPVKMSMLIENVKRLLKEKGQNGRMVVDPAGFNRSWEKER